MEWEHFLLDHIPPNEFRIGYVLESGVLGKLLVVLVMFEGVIELFSSEK